MQVQPLVGVTACRFLVFLGVVATISVAQPVIAPLALAVLISFMLAPVARFLESRGCSRSFAVVLIGLGMMGTLCSVGYALVVQFVELTTKLGDYAGSVAQKVADLRTTGAGALRGVERILDAANQAVRVTPVAGAAPLYVASPPPTPFHRLIGALGPALEPLGMLVAVLVLILFMLAQREDLRDRLIRLGGRGKIGLTTKTLDEVAFRISRFLITQLAISTGLGLLVSIGLTAIGVPYALLWGALTVVLRFVPFVGVTIAVLQPAILAFALFPGWREVVMTIVLFLVLDLLAAYLVEPLVIGGRTGLSSLALLVSALFWTWLWGPLGLVLSTPIAVCLMVAGKHVTELEIFAVLLGDEPALGADLSFCQRLVAGDEDDANELFEAALAQFPTATAFDRTLLPALIMADRERLHGQIGADVYGFILRAVRTMLDRWDDSLSAAPLEGREDDARGEATRIVIVAARTVADEIASRMVARALGPIAEVELIPASVLAAELTSRIGDVRPELVCIATMPPGGVLPSTYTCKRIRRAFPAIRIVVLRMDLLDGGRVVSSFSDRLRSAGADAVVSSCLELRNLVTAQPEPAHSMRPRAHLAEPDPGSSVLPPNEA